MLNILTEKANKQELKIYLSGKITGKDEKEVFQLFEEREKFLTEKGYQVLNPMKLSHNHDKKWESYMKECIKNLLDCNAIMLIGDDWKDSRGVGLELFIAISLDYYLLTDKIVDYIENEQNSKEIKNADVLTAIANAVALASVLHDKISEMVGVSMKSKENDEPNIQYPENILDLDGYPTAEALDFISEFDVAKYGSIKLVKFIQKIWKFSEWGFRLNGKKAKKVLYLSTGGWSGNEKIIRALQKNTAFWNKCWEKTKVGGHYKFIIENEKN